MNEDVETTDVERTIGEMTMRDLVDLIDDRIKHQQLKEATLSFIRRQNYKGNGVIFDFRKGAKDVIKVIDAKDDEWKAAKSETPSLVFDGEIKAIFLTGDVTVSDPKTKEKPTGDDSSG